ncbi:MAG: flavodoxin domain-containing protein [Caldilineaceae bacterium]|nr:flavodoxin domain-containing protein [Caldilineaceae bacterium]
MASPKVLVVYGSKHGATAEIAERIGAVLRLEGLDADVTEVAGARNVEAYDAVVLGSAVYAGMWRRDAVRFLEANEQTLATRPVWFFSSGPTGDGDPVELVNGWQFPVGQLAIADRIGPRATALFHGKIDLQKLNLIEKFMIKAAKAQAGDYRAWGEVTAWAQSIAQELRGVLATG